MNAAVAPVARILVAGAEDRFKIWESERVRDSGLRHRFLPQWCKDVWNKDDDCGSGSVPVGKFVNQAAYHYGEAYCMAVIAGVTKPISWSVLQGERITPSEPPAWLRGGFETLYECFRLLDETQPGRQGPYAYGEEILTRALDAGGEAATVVLRRWRTALAQMGCAVTQPDLLALPREGGQLVAIECKRLHRDRISQAQLNGLDLLRRCDVRCEVWWIAQEETPRPPSPVSRGENLIVHPGVRDAPVPKIAVRAGMPWESIRAEALAGSRTGSSR